MFLYLIADVPRHFQTAVWGLSSKGFRRHIKANSVSSKLVVKSDYNPLKTPVNQGLSDIIIEFLLKFLNNPILILFILYKIYFLYIENSIGSVVL